MQFIHESAERQPIRFSRRRLIPALALSALALASCSRSNGSTNAPTLSSTATPEPDNQLMSRYLSILPASPVSDLLKVRMGELFGGKRVINRGGININLHGSKIDRKIGSNPNAFNGYATIRGGTSLIPYPIHTATQETVLAITLRTALIDNERRLYDGSFDAEGNIKVGNVGFRAGSTFADGIAPYIELTLPNIRDPKLLESMMTYLLVKEGFSLLLMDLMIETALKKANDNKTNILIPTATGDKEGMVETFRVLFTEGYPGQNVTGAEGTRLMAIADLGGLALATNELINTSVGKVFSEFPLIKKTQAKIGSYNFGATPSEVFDQTAAWCIANAKPTEYWAAAPGEDVFFRGNFDRLP